MNSIDDDSPWDADPNPSYHHQSEWSKITSDFTNVRHRFNDFFDTNSNLITLNRRATAKG